MLAESGTFMTIGAHSLSEMKQFLAGFQSLLIGWGPQSFGDFHGAHDFEWGFFLKGSWSGGIAIVIVVAEVDVILFVEEGEAGSGVAVFGLDIVAIFWGFSFDYPLLYLHLLNYNSQMRIITIKKGITKGR